MWQGVRPLLMFVLKESFYLSDIAVFLTSNCAAICRGMLFARYTYSAIVSR
jgi:hypothetical protein